MSARTIALLSFAAVTFAGTFAPALADEPTFTTNIAEKQADCKDGKCEKGGAGPGGCHRHHHHRPGAAIKRIKSLKSLTDDQKKQIDQIVDNLKKEIEPLRQEAQGLRESLIASHKAAQEKATQDKGSADKGSADKAAPDAAGGKKLSAADQKSRDRLFELRSAMHEKSKSAIGQIKALLTEDQVKELKSMRRPDGPPPADAPPASKPEAKG